MSKILFVMTGADKWTLKDGTQHPTGFWAEEATAPYEAFTHAGFDIVVATPGGVIPPVDKASLSAEANGGDEGVDKTLQALEDFPELKNPISLHEVHLNDYAAVFYPGGHGPMEDLAKDPNSGELLIAALNSGKPLGIVCHAPAALLATIGPDGTSPFAGYRMTGFTNAEEEQAGHADKAPWLLQDRLVALGADFRESDPWAPHVEADRNLFTGQNPASSAPLAQKMLDALQE
ncbi:type 1 glutamine amidotransferase domain-containing protein [Hoyosella rhizosphaerae]|uniref:Dimethylallyltransferase n=1 Tax=Hoyosella rhizosphaerae TaxID=1755582 RepID=A0A916XA49_9ACTN|nr:type 1 glutamine amidotransferase domain-containing protein [Hoyosella rhizosphaerae]MBN4926825.1 type 1 glutamine amidotransferase domain-containing protein [Hoyosella rhizosphaerae]GGC56197.1 dimethylallyltransferase [Hoyosella rhizosphaerae]